MTRRYRSRFEEQTAKQLKQAKVRHQYEKQPLRYEDFGRTRTYWPDFIIITPDKAPVFLEVKGWLRDGDRWKFEKVRTANPGIDLRFCFMNAEQTVDDGETYAQWAESLGWAFCERELPQEWIKEWKGEDED